MMKATHFKILGKTVWQFISPACASSPTLTAGLPLILVLLLQACSTTPKVQSEARPGADYARYRTFALLPLPTTSPASDPGLMLRFAEPARQAVIEALSAKGFQPAERARADFVVNLRGSSMPKVEVQDWGYTRTVYSRRFAGVPVHVGQTDVRTYEEKTLTVEVFDNTTHELVWVGWMTKRTTGARTKPEQLKEAIHAILAEFPPPASVPSPTK